MSEQHPAEKIAAEHASEQHKKGTKRRIGKDLDYYANKYATGGKKPKHQPLSLHKLASNEINKHRNATSDKDKKHQIALAYGDSLIKGYDLQKDLGKSGRQKKGSLYKLAANKIAHDPQHMYDQSKLPKEVKKDIKKESLKKSKYHKK
jgi:hypothetical protein